MWYTGVRLQAASLFAVTIALGTQCSADVEPESESEQEIEQGPESQKELVDYLLSRNHIKDKSVADIMYKVDRTEFCENFPYADLDVGIGFWATIEDPSLQANFLQQILKILKKGSKVLEVGSGSGYISTCLAIIVGDKGRVIGVDHIPELVKQAEKNLMKSHKKYLDSGRVKFLCRDGRLGLPEEAPFDFIHVGAVATQVPKALVNQMKKGGHMLIVLGRIHEYQNMTILHKDLDGRITETVVKQVIANDELYSKDEQMSNYNETLQ